jgi:hypothetical protein
LVKALVLGIHFAKTQRQKTKKILADLNKRTGENFQYDRLERMPRKPYPDAQAIINAYELGCIKSPEAKQQSPLALWDLHYLRTLDHSGFIDKSIAKSAGALNLSYKGFIQKRSSLRALGSWHSIFGWGFKAETIGATEFVFPLFSARCQFFTPRQRSLSATARLLAVSK